MLLKREEFFIRCYRCDNCLKYHLTSKPLRDFSKKTVDIQK